jgi:hypothetical protein
VACAEDLDLIPTYYQRLSRQRSGAIDSDIDMAGSLYKLNNGTWKQRWFVLRHGGILYKYVSPKVRVSLFSPFSVDLMSLPY